MAVAIVVAVATTSSSEGLWAEMHGVLRRWWGRTRRLSLRLLGRDC